MEEAIRRDSLDEISSPSSAVMWTSARTQEGTIVVEGVGIVFIFGLSFEAFLEQSLQMWPFSTHLWKVYSKFYEEALVLEEEVSVFVPFFLDLAWVVKAIESNFVEVAFNQSSWSSTMGTNSSHVSSVILPEVIKEE